MKFILIPCVIYHYKEELPFNMKQCTSRNKSYEPSKMEEKIKYSWQQNSVTSRPW